MRTATTLLLLLVSSAAYGQIYTWHDADGKVQYSDVPPAGQADVREIQPAAGNPADVESARRNLAEKEMEFNKRRQDAAKAAAKAEQDQAKAEDRERNCAQAKSYLRSLESGERISRIDAKGERIFLDDSARSQEIGATKRSVESWCK